MSVLDLFPSKKFFIEGVVLGRNDDYEKGWAERLEASIAYNHTIFKESGVDYRVVFVEWNPPPEKPLLSPTLIAKYPFVRAIVVDPEVHRRYNKAIDLEMMLTFSFNAGLRTSSADYCMITTGDLFFGSDLVKEIADKGLKRDHLYRAERVNIRNDLDFDNPRAEYLEAPENVVSLDSCSIPPFEEPPYTNACGDFILLDQASVMAVRGFDESVRNARLHTDARYCWTAMKLGISCDLIGHVYHINHGQSYTNLRENYPGADYDYEANIPYLNPDEWGLGDHEWHRVSDRLFEVKPSAEGVIPDFLQIPEPLTPRDARKIKRQRAKLVAARKNITPEHPRGPTTEVPRALNIHNIETLPHWDGANIEIDGNIYRLTTGAKQWSYAAQIPLPRKSLSHKKKYYWVSLSVQVVDGSIGIGNLVAGDIVSEVVIEKSDGFQEIFVPIRTTADEFVIIRNVSTDERGSTVELKKLSIQSLPKDEMIARLQNPSQFPIPEEEPSVATETDSRKGNEWEDKYVFIHIPKTGGTSFQFSFMPAITSKKERFRLSGLFPQNHIDREALLRAPKHLLAKIKMIAGHNAYGLHKYIDGLKYISISRDPVEIAISHYLHAMHHDSQLFGDPSKSVPDYMRENNISLEQFVQKDLAVTMYGDECLTVQNSIFKALTYGEEADTISESRADLEKLVNRVSYFGVTHQLDLFLFSLHIRAGFPLVLYNNRLVRKSRDYEKLTITEDIKDTIRSYNKQDTIIHKIVEERFKADIHDLWSDEVEEKWTRHQEALEKYREETGGDDNKYRVVSYH